ncbi:MAG: aminotransferase class I/II-fold pyridoxal phosphate-dependent enzyme [Rickettsiales bacterium]
MTHNFSHIGTLLTHEGTIRSEFGEMSEALYLNSAYRFPTAEAAEARFNRTDPGYTYSRYSNPNIDMLERRLCALEGAESCVAVGSGMAGIFSTLMCFLRPGDNIVANKVLFGSCYYIVTQILPRYGIGVALVDGGNENAWDRAFSDKKIAAAFIETPSNPNLGLTDVTALSEHCRSVGAKLIVDNIFAGPLSQQPLSLGADAVVYSTTKHIDGQGRCLGGAVLGGRDFIMNALQPFVRHTGPGISPFNAWLAFKSLETLSVRYERHVANAAAVAEFLSNHPAVERLHYPGHDSHPQRALAKKQMLNGGSVLSFEVKGGKEKAFAFLNRLKLISIANNFGDSRSIANHPASTTHASIPKAEQRAVGISDGLCRFSAGLEHIDDMIADMDAALKS